MLAMGQNPVPPVNIPIQPVKKTKMGDAPTNQNGTIGVDPQPLLEIGAPKMVVVFLVAQDTTTRVRPTEDELRTKADTPQTSLNKVPSKADTPSSFRNFQSHERVGLQILQASWLRSCSEIQRATWKPSGDWLPMVAGLGLWFR